MAEVTEEMIAADNQKERILTLEEYHQIIGLVAIRENAELVKRDVVSAIVELMDPKIDPSIIETMLDRSHSAQSLINQAGFKVDFRRA